MSQDPRSTTPQRVVNDENAGAAGIGGGMGLSAAQALTAGGATDTTVWNQRLLDSGNATTQRDFTVAAGVLTMTSAGVYKISYSAIINHASAGAQELQFGCTASTAGVIISCVSTSDQATTSLSGVCVVSLADAETLTFSTTTPALTTPTLTTNSYVLLEKLQ